MQGHVSSVIVRNKQAVVRLVEEKINGIVKAVDWLFDRKKIDSIGRCQSQVWCKDKLVSGKD